MDWREAVKRSPEDTAVLHRGRFSYLRYPNGSTFHATSGDYKIKDKCREEIVSNNWEPLYNK